MSRLRRKIGLWHLSPNVFYQTNPSPWHTISLNQGITLLNLNFQTIKFTVNLEIATIFVIIFSFKCHFYSRWVHRVSNRKGCGTTILPGLPWSQRDVERSLASGVCKACQTWTQPGHQSNLIGITVRRESKDRGNGELQVLSISRDFFCCQEREIRHTIKVRPLNGRCFNLNFFLLPSVLPSPTIRHPIRSGYYPGCLPLPCSQKLKLNLQSNIYWPEIMFIVYYYAASKF